MYSSILSLAALTGATLAVPVRQLEGLGRSNTCAAVHMIVARATGEPPGEGIIGSLAQNLSATIPGADSEALVYPASFPYSASIPDGVENMKNAIAAYTQRCPMSQLVLMGYSQGAAVTADTLCGGGGNQVGPVTPGLTEQEGMNVKAVVMMGDPRFVPGVSYDAGTNKLMSGVAERNPEVAVCQSFADRMVSYCDMNDSRCASGNSLEVHLSYTKTYNTQAAQFVNAKIGEGAISNSTGSGVV